MNHELSGGSATRLVLDMSPQPDDTSCGPTCLHAVYAYFDDPVPLEVVLEEVQALESGGTVALHLADHALRRGYRATIYTYNLELFDPTWFGDDGRALPSLPDRLREQAARKTDTSLRELTRGYLEYLRLGGRVRFEELRADLVRRFLKRDRPILTGLSATYLYDSPRESGPVDQIREDDVGGEPVGHFVVLCGYDRKTREVAVADPLHDNPKFGTHLYTVSIDRVMGAILLGVLTHDANLLVLDPPARA